MENSELLQAYLQRKRDAQLQQDEADRSASNQEMIGAGLKLAGALTQSGEPVVYQKGWNETGAPVVVKPERNEVDTSFLEKQAERTRQSGRENYSRDLDSFQAEQGLIDLEQKRKQNKDAQDRELKLRSSEEDPASESSVTAQMLASKMLPGKDFSKMSASQIKTVLPSISKMYDIEQDRLSRQDNRAARQSELAQRRADKETDLKARSDEKKKETLVEIEDRRTNIKQNISVLKQMIQEDGTFETFGSHNQDLDRLVEQIAIDMSKLSDPNSVARPSEVEAVKKNLVKPGFSNTNSTALDVLNNFEKEVDTRADSAYKIRGIDKPGGSAAPGIDPRVDSFMKKNGIADYNEALQILKSAGKI